MIVVRVELWSANTGKRTELARMVIANAGDGIPHRHNYTGATLRGRNEAVLDRSLVNRTYTREGVVRDHPRLTLHVWHLVGKMLDAMGYGSR